METRAGGTLKALIPRPQASIGLTLDGFEPVGVSGHNLDHLAPYAHAPLLELVAEPGAVHHVNGPVLRGLVGRLSGEAAYDRYPNRWFRGSRATLVRSFALPRVVFCATASHAILAPRDP